MDRTPIIANMCDNCVHKVTTTELCGDTLIDLEVCELNFNPSRLPCVENNEQCPDHRERK